jgi:opacity protein-like surface antigen
MARAHVLGALSALLVATSAQAQQAVDSAARPAMDRRLRAEIGFVATVLRGVSVPRADDFRLGSQEIAVGAASAGAVAVARGNLVVRGRVAGDALVLHGDIIVYPGGVIAGNAVTVDGRVHAAGGVIEGDVRSIRGVTGSILARAAGRAADEQPVTMLAALKMALGWFAVLFVIGVGVLLFAERNLDGVVVALQQDFSRSFWTGLLAQLAAIPALLLVLVGLCVTLVGILLVPFAIVAFVIGLAGLVTLGFIAVSRFTGRAFVGMAESRRAHLQSLIVGLALYLGWWFLAALFVSNPMVGSVLRAVALAVSWVGLTFGLGATILTRAGTRRKAEPATARTANELSWQTPTPVTGVVAARRPVATVKQG